MNTNHERTRVAVVDDHAAVRRGLAAVLSTEDDFELVGEASNGLAALRMCVELRPNVVLIDLVMPGMDGIATTRAIHQQLPHIRIIALTGFNEEQLVYDVLEAGAVGYLLKNVGAQDLAQAIRTAHAGPYTGAPDAAQALIDRGPSATLAG